jgi:hypothetical protein
MTESMTAISEPITEPMTAITEPMTAITEPMTTMTKYITDIGMKWPIFEYIPIESYDKVVPKTEPIPFHITVKSMTGKYTTVYIHNKMTIQEVKIEIDKVDKIPLHHQRLVFNGKELQDDSLVESYHLQSNDIIHIILRLRGGMFHETSSRMDHVHLGDSKATLLEIEDLEKKIYLKRSLFYTLRLSKEVSSNWVSEPPILLLKPTDCLPLL